MVNSGSFGNPRFTMFFLSRLNDCECTNTLAQKRGPRATVPTTPPDTVRRSQRWRSSPRRAAVELTLSLRNTGLSAIWKASPATRLYARKRETGLQRCSGQSSARATEPTTPADHLRIRLTSPSTPSTLLTLGYSLFAASAARSPPCSSPAPSLSPRAPFASPPLPLLPSRCRRRGFRLAPSPGHLTAQPASSAS